MDDKLNSDEQNCLKAGKFSRWLDEFIKAMKGEKSIKVPCGHCVACCTPSNFIHIRPTDKDTLKCIPSQVLFPAPGLPKGHFLLGYNDDGQCPMFRGGKCSIYENRPEICRQYDCRVYSATGIPLDNIKSDIARQVKRWEFDISSSFDLEKHKAVRMAAEFLQKYNQRFPARYILKTNAQLAIFAIRIHELFIGQDSSTVDNDFLDIIDQIVSKFYDD